LQRRGAGQRKFRNALVFVAADESTLDTCRQLARKYLAWKSIVDDKELADSLTRAQYEDARSRMGSSLEVLTQRIRHAWSHVLYPVGPQDVANSHGPAIGFDIEHCSVSNRAPGKPIAQVVYDKLKANSVIIDQLGPNTLMAELRKVWNEDAPHMAVTTLVDWFASYTYLPRLRDEVTLTTAIEKLISDIDAPIAFARSHNADNGAYEGVSLWSNINGADIKDGLLVWRSLIPAPVSDLPDIKAEDQGTLGNQAISEEATSHVSRQRSNEPRRFYGSIPLNPDQAGLQVAKIAEEILFELTRAKGSELKLTLEIEASAPAGYSDDVVDVIRANIRDLKIDPTNIGFETD